MNPYKKVFSELQKSGVKYLVVGGVAVNLYGYSRFTGDIDILAGYSLDFKKFYKKRAVMKVWGTRLPVISFDDLIAMKKDAGREKDLLDLKALIELKSL